jgi:glycosyltransferase involved in cell wall biosynthesis
MPRQHRSTEYQRMRIALYHPWVYVKSGLERTLLEIARRSRHQWVIYTSHYDREGTYPELQDVEIVELSRVSVRRNYGSVLRSALRIALTSLDPELFDVLVISCDGLGDLLTLRNTSRPILCLCHTPLRAVFDPDYRTRLLVPLGVIRPVALMLDAGFRLLDRICWRRYDAVVVMSDEVRKRIVAGGLYPANAIQVLHSGVDAERIGLARRWERFFLIAGRIMWTKNVELGLEAFAQARAQLRDDFRLIIAGMIDAKSQNYATSLKSRAAEIGGIEFVINPSDAVLSGLYEQCTALVFTAFNEDWGLVPLEAMAAGKPVIAVDKGGPRESVVDGETGFLEPNDPAAFARRMVQLAGDSVLAREMGSAGSERARLFSWTSYVAGLDDVIDRLVAPPIFSNEPLAAG